MSSLSNKTKPQFKRAYEALDELASIAESEGDEDLLNSILELHSSLLAIRALTFNAPR